LPVSQPCRIPPAVGEADEAGKILVDEFTAKYPGWAQPARVAAGVATVYREIP
jgi:hypothetical protein